MCAFTYTIGYTLGFKQTNTGLSMCFAKGVYRISRKQAMFGKNIIITDYTDWTTREIVKASLDRWQVEDRFRLSKKMIWLELAPSGTGRTAKSAVTCSLV